MHRLMAFNVKGAMHFHKQKYFQLYKCIQLEGMSMLCHTLYASLSQDLPLGRQNLSYRSIIVMCMGRQIVFYSDLWVSSYQTLRHIALCHIPKSAR